MVSIKAVKGVNAWLLAAFGALLLTTLIYAAKTSWQSAEQIARLEDDGDKVHAKLAAEIGALKKSLVKMLLKGRPDEAAIAEGLVSPTALSGIKSFNSGNFQGAYAIWSKAAEAGDPDALIAMRSALPVLQLKSQDLSTPTQERQAAQTALLVAAKEIKESTVQTLEGRTP